MEKYSKAFKAYDIRGIFGEDIDSYFCFILGYATGQDLIQKHDTSGSILVSSDTRIINKELIDQYIIGLTQAGISHIDTVQASANNQYPYGITSTSAAYHIGQKDRDMTAIFTASHNPTEYVGIKCFDSSASLTPTDHLQNIFAQAFALWENKPIPTTANPYTSKHDIVNTKIQSYYQTTQTKRSQLQKNHKFVVDFCHGSAVSLEKTFYETYATNHLITMINDYPDGTFPSHEGDTGEPKNYAQLIQELHKQGAEFGIMFDGDADRIGFVSNTGAVIPGDIIYAIIVKQLLQKRTDHPICIYDCMSSKIVAETIEQYGGVPQMYKVGRFFINHEMARVNALAGGEVSGHYMFGELGCVESVLIAQYYVMKELEEYNDFDTMLQQYQKYYKGPIQSISVQNKETVMQNIQQAFADHKQEYLDGVSIYTHSYRCNIRPSNTENKIRFTVEADDQKTRQYIVDKLKQHIA